MLSRRNIRIKAMQALYATRQDEYSDFQEAENTLEQLIESSYDLFYFNVFVFLKILEESKADFELRSKKYLPTEQDKKFQPILFNNELVQSIISSERYYDPIKVNAWKNQVDPDIIKKIYHEFSKAEEYEAYATAETHDKQDHIDILHFVLRVVKNLDAYQEILYDHYVNYIDDNTLLIGTTKKLLKALPVNEELDDVLFKNDKEIRAFGEELFRKTFSKDDFLTQLIEPKLKNWDLDRLAAVDVICIKMAITELLEFPTIPVKVSLNEYVELVKAYSTDKSKEFINGVLDRIFKELEDEGKIVKKGRGLID